MLQAVGDMIIIKLHREEKKGGIYIPEKAQQERSDFYGIVVSVGEDSKKDLKVGDKVLFPRHEGVLIEHEEEKYYAMKDQHLIGVIV